MIQMRTWLTVADNSGARRLMCILPLGGDAGSRAGLGDIITASVKEAAPDRKSTRLNSSHIQKSRMPSSA